MSADLRANFAVFSAGETSWSSPVNVATLPPNEVHVWRIGLDLDAAPAPGLWEMLSPDECARAVRFRRALDRRRFVIRRSAIRRILASYFGRPASELRFQYGPAGKPALPAARPDVPTFFNLAHSGGLALLAVACQPVGVDVEQTRPLPDAAAVARRFFSEAEREALDTLPPERWLGGFYTCWTRKEAFIKATGEGLSRPLESFDVSLLSDAAGITVAGDPAAGAGWSLRDLSVGAGYSASLAVAIAAGADCRVCLCCWDHGMPAGDQAVSLSEMSRC